MGTLTQAGRWRRGKHLNRGGARVEPKIAALRAAAERPSREEALLSRHRGRSSGGREGRPFSLSQIGDIRHPLCRDRPALPRPLLVHY